MLLKIIWIVNAILAITIVGLITIVAVRVLFN